MRARAELQLGIGAILFIQIIATFGTIGLLSRMSPIVGHILAENVYSAQAAEDMLSALVLAERPVPDQASLDMFEKALTRAWNNVTEKDEKPLLALIQREGRRALQGDRVALQVTVDSLRKFAEINRRSIHRADLAAKRIGSAGAWASVFLGLSAVGLGLIVIRRLNRRILDPLADLASVLEDVREGELHRRFRTPEATLEFLRISPALNRILDRYTALRCDIGGSGHLSAIDRALLLKLLDERAHPLAVVDANGRLTIANTAGYRLLSGPGGDQLRDALARVPAQGAQGPIIKVEAVESGMAFFCILASGNVPRTGSP